ncbi:MAG: twin-arginine translocase TatA/TatE family subunit [Desulfoarculaceae bacterium]|nr:twin-arginine translocase TatA/TatE family subunit [Desulfoarculaceae bacterium]
MFGIGLPEMILILALALIVVGPDKLPELARSMAKGIMELKRTAEALKKNLTEDGTLDSLKPDVSKLLESSPWEHLSPGEGVNPTPDKTADAIIEAEITVVDDSKPVSIDDQNTEEISQTAAQPDSEETAKPTRHDDNTKP